MRHHDRRHPGDRRAAGHRGRPPAPRAPARRAQPPRDVPVARRAERREPDSPVPDRLARSICRSARTRTTTSTPGASSTRRPSNYSFVLEHTNFFKWLESTLIVSLGTTVVGVLFAATTGYAVSRMRFPGHRKLMWVLLLTQAFPIAVLIVPMYEILGDLGLIDTYGGLILVYCSTAVPYCAWLLKGYFDTIPYEIDEAGRIDGLSPFGTFARLIVPLAKPGLAVAAFYSFITAFGEVAFASTFMLDDEKYTFAVGLRSFVSEHDAQWNYMAATAVLIAIPVSAFFYLVQRNLVTGLTAGGTKG